MSKKAQKEKSRTLLLSVVEDETGGRGIERKMKGASIKGARPKKALFPHMLLSTGGRWNRGRLCKEEEGRVITPPRERGGKTNPSGKNS